MSQAVGAVIVLPDDHQSVLGCCSKNKRLFWLGRNCEVLPYNELGAESHILHLGQYCVSLVGVTPLQSCLP